MINPVETSIRVRYAETDGQGVVHHGNYMTYFELGRIEHLRANGMVYSEFEANGHFLVVANVECKYLAPVRFDDELILRTNLVDHSRVKLVHTYQVLRDERIMTEAKTTIVCVDREGKVTRLPEKLIC
jgi:acyl-CoA thioester hydrolase